jgi:hypothetical protein
VGDATSSLGDAKISLGDATSSLADATSSLGAVQVRAVEAAQLEHAYEQTLLRVAADPSCADAAELPAGAAQELGEVRATVALLAAAAADDAEAMKGARTHLAKLRRLLKSSERNRDLFAQAGGVSAVMALYTEDNQAVLVSCRGG